MKIRFLQNNYIYFFLWMLLYYATSRLLFFKRPKKKKKKMDKNLFGKISDEDVDKLSTQLIESLVEGKKKKVKFEREENIKKIYEIQKSTPEKTLQRHAANVMIKMQNITNPEELERFRESKNNELLSELHNDRLKKYEMLSPSEINIYEQYNNAVNKLKEKKAKTQTMLELFKNKLLDNAKLITKLLESDLSIEPYNVEMTDITLKNVKEVMTRNKIINKEILNMIASINSDNDRINFINTKLESMDKNGNIGNVLIYDETIENVLDRIERETLNLEQTKHFRELEIMTDLELEKKYEEQAKNIEKEMIRRKMKKEQEEQKKKKEKELYKQTKQEQMDIIQKAFDVISKK